MEASVAQVLLDSRLPQLDRLLDFAVPAALRDEIAVGVRVRVPLRGGRLTAGYVVALSDTSDYAGELEQVERVVSPVRVLHPEVLELARGVAERAAGNTADVLRLAIPPRQARVEQKFEPPDPQPIDESMRDLWPQLQPGTRWVADMPGGIARVGEESVGRWAVTIAEMVAATLARGQQAIVVVPDHREQWQLQAALEETIGTERIAALDARQSNPDRYRSFLLAGSGIPVAAVGPRSTVYAPAGELGLIVVWDDGDPLLREPLAPHVHARDAALLRQSQSNAALVFAGHTRSTAVQRLAELGWLQQLPLAAARRPKPLPAALIADQHGRVPSVAHRAIAEGLTTGPVLVQVAKPGYATRIVCVDCGERVGCGFCSGPLRHRRGSWSCLWCGRPLGERRCQECGGRRLNEAGSGSARTAHDLGRAFPGVPVTLADGDHEHLRVDDRPRLVVATVGAAPVAADGYRAVVLLDGESAMMGERLSVAEDAVRQWRNALALAADDAACVVTGVGAELVQALVPGGAADFAHAELDERRRLGFPPAVRVASVYGAAAQTERAAAALEGIRGVDTLGTVAVEGPAGAPEVRTIVRFPYDAGPEVSSRLRAEILRAAAGRRKGSGRLRVRLDDTEPFEGAGS